MSDPQMQKIRELFDGAGTLLGRKTCLELAEARVVELIDRLPRNPWPFHVGDGRAAVEGVSSTETLADGLLARLGPHVANREVEVEGG